MIRWPLATLVLCSCADLIGITDEQALEVSELSVSAGTLTPAFDPAITQYQLSVGYQDATLQIQATANDPGAVIEIAGLESVAGSGAASVAVGDTTIEVVARTSSGVAARYAIGVHRGDLQLGFVTTPRSVPTSLPGMVSRAELADLDGDGRLDLGAMTNNGEIAMLTNNGAAQFAFRSTFAYGLLRDVAFRDLNADGRPELVVTTSGSLQVAHNRGNGEFDPPVGCGASPAPGAFATLQLNADGIPDLVLADQNGRLMPMTGTASGCFSSLPAMDQMVSPTPLTAVQSGVLDAQIGDDVATLDPVAARIFVHRNLGAGLSLDPVDLGPASSRPVELVMADTDGDGRDELIWIDAATEEVVVQPFPGPRGPGFHVGGRPRSLTVVDVDADGKLDVVVLDDGGVTVLHNERGPGPLGSTSFATKALPMQLGGVQRIALGDLNGDGRADLVTANFTSSVNVYLGVVP